MSKMFAWLGVWIVLFAGTVVQAENIGVNWKLTSVNVIAPGTSDGPVAQINWNNVEGWDFQSVSTLKNDSGVNTTLGINWYQTQGDGEMSQASSNLHSGDSPLTNVAIGPAPEAASVQLNNIPYESYSIQASIGTGAPGYRMAGVTKQILTYQTTTAGWVEATSLNNWTGNYVKWSGLSGVSQNLQAVDGWSNDGMIGFIQVSQPTVVPEPSTFVLAGLGLAGLSLGALRKKFRRVALS